MAKLPHLRQSIEISPGPTKLNLPVFISSSVLIVVVSIIAAAAPAKTNAVLMSVVSWFSTWFGFFYIALATIILGFVLWLAMSRYGRLRLGHDNSRPEFSFFSWAAMLFAAGIGSDILFFSVAEPVTHFLQPPYAEPESIEAARQAVVWGLFHYGITGWGMYSLVGIALGYFAYRRGLPLAVRSALFPLIGRRVEGKIGDCVDIAAVLATIFGIAVSLGIGVVQLSLGLSILGVPFSRKIMEIVLIVIAVMMAAISATTGLDRGIRLLSQLNVCLGIFLGGWVLFTGNTPFLLSAFVTNVGDYLSSFPRITLDAMPYGDYSAWMGAWTLFFWTWWIAWASFIGMFLARISRGRTIRQLVFGSLVIPFMYVAMWINIFGDDAIDLIRRGNRELADAVLESPEQGIYQLLQSHSLPMFSIAVAVVVGLLFYVTSADSGALVMTNLCSNLAHPGADGAHRVRIFWASVTGVLTIVTLAIGGIPALQNATIIMAVPFSFVLVAVMFGLHRAITTEGRSSDLHAQIFEEKVVAKRDESGSRLPWGELLATALSTTDRKQARQALNRTVVPALTEVAETLTEFGAEASVIRAAASAEESLDADPSRALIDESDVATLVVGSDQESFYYQVTVVMKPTPGLAGFMVREADTSAVLEVCVPGRNINYNIMGLSIEQIRRDVVENYERYLAYLQARSLQSGKWGGAAEGKRETLPTRLKRRFIHDHH